MGCPTIDPINPFKEFKSCSNVINVDKRPFSIREDHVFRGEEKIGKIISNSIEQGHVQFIHINENRFLNGTIGHLYYKVENDGK